MYRLYFCIFRFKNRNHFVVNDSDRTFISPSFSDIVFIILFCRFISDGDKIKIYFKNWWISIVDHLKIIGKARDVNIPRVNFFLNFVSNFFF